MRYEIIGNIVPAVECTLNTGETMFTQSGGMIWQSDGIEMTTNTKGGGLKSLGRLLAGESIFMANYTAKMDGSTIAFGSTVSGKIVPVNVSNTEMICQKGAFLCAENGVKLEITFTKRLGAGLFGGEGFVLQKISGSGMAFLEADGDVVEKVLAPGESIKVDTGNVVAFESSVKYDIETVKGLKNVLLGGEGLFLTRLTGPGRVVLQTQNFNDFINRIVAVLPKSNS